MLYDPHTLAGKAVCDTLGVDPNRGLDKEQVNASRARFGTNRVAGHKIKPAWRIFFEQFADPVIYVLGTAALLVILVLQGRRVHRTRYRRPHCYARDTAIVLASGVVIAVVMITSVVFFLIFLLYTTRGRRARKAQADVG